MSLDGPGGVATLEGEGVVRAWRAVTGDSTNVRTPNVSLLRLRKGHFQVPTSIVTPRVSTPTKIEAVHVHPML